MYNRVGGCSRCFMRGGPEMAGVHPKRRFLASAVRVQVKAVRRCVHTLVRAHVGVAVEEFAGCCEDGPAPLEKSGRCFAKPRDTATPLLGAYSRGGGLCSRQDLHCMFICCCHGPRPARPSWLEGGTRAPPCDGLCVQGLVPILKLPHARFLFWLSGGGAVSGIVQVLRGRALSHVTRRTRSRSPSPLPELSLGMLGPCGGSCSGSVCACLCDGSHVAWTCFIYFYLKGTLSAGFLLLAVTLGGRSWPPESGWVGRPHAVPPSGSTRELPLAGVTGPRLRGVCLVSSSHLALEVLGRDGPRMASRHLWPWVSLLCPFLALVALPSFLLLAPWPAGSLAPPGSLVGWAV